MRNLFIAFCLVFPRMIWAQYDDIVNSAIDVTDLALEANDMIYMATETEKQRQLLEKNLESIHFVLDNPNYSSMFSVNERADYLEKTREYGNMINFYGTSLKYVLNTVKKSMEQYAATQALKTTNEVTSDIQSEVEEIQEKADAIMGTTNLSGTKRVVQQGSTDKELGHKIRELTKNIKDVMPMIMDANQAMMKMNTDVRALSNALGGSLGMKVMFLLSSTAQGAEIFTRLEAKEYEKLSAMQKRKMATIADYNKATAEVSMDLKNSGGGPSGKVGALNPLTKTVDAQSQANITGSSSSNHVDYGGGGILDDADARLFVNEVYRWFYYLFGLGFIITFLVGSYKVYSKTSGENGQAFLQAAGMWLKGLGYSLLVFGALASLKLLLVAGSLFS